MTMFVVLIHMPLSLTVIFKNGKRVFK